MFNGLKRALALKVLNDLIKDYLKNMPTNMKTTTLGILGIIVAGASAGIQLLQGHTPDWSALIASVTLGWGLIAAKDAH